ncbi:preprotein translocase subunit SecG [Marinagarivorans algicola]|uniref:preprotein translocase subunit SecG n=1 Tax=Marinagarivorans algicola TaxID=1513270 RepID=UPI0009E7A0B9|nr:preprotein translocase subunit SecG [Marinagarivorans algicola]
MENFILVVHVLLALGIIGLIMLQQGKGAEAGASFGSGSSQTVFGAAGTGNFFSRMTGILAALFFITSVTLAVVAKNSSVIDEDFLPDSAVIESAVGDIENNTTDLQAGSAEALEGDANDPQKTLENAAKALETE